MKLLKSIFVLSLITITNITQAFYIALDDGKEVTRTSTCIKINLRSRQVTRQCIFAKQFVLENNRLCTKKNKTVCLSKWTPDRGRTFFASNTSNWLTVKEFNEEGGYFHVDHDGQVRKYKYSGIDLMFISNYAQPITFPTKAGLWINTDGLCWTADYGYGPIYLSTCRSLKRNQKRANKVQHWKTEFDANTNATYIKSADGVMCLTMLTNKAKSIKCDKNDHDAFRISHDRQIAPKFRPKMCLIPRLDGRKNIMILGPCIQSLKLVKSIA